MKNKHVGLLIIGISLLIGFIIFSFNRAMTAIVGEACSHGPSCAMWKTLDLQTNISMGVMLFIVMIGLYFVFLNKDEITSAKQKNNESGNAENKVKKFDREDYQDVMKELTEEEQTILNKILEAEGTIFQSELVDVSGFPKVKVTRILDRLEGRGLIERKRRGMTNIVILKHR